MPLLEDLGSKIPKTGVQALSIVVDFDVFENRFRGTSELTPRSDKCATGKRGSGGMDKPKHAAPRPNRASFWAVRETFCGLKPEFRTDYAREGRSRRLRTRERLAKAQVTNSRWAFFSRPR